MAEFTEKTIKELGVYVTAPKLTEKLLSKPPFRYLHDIIMGFMKVTGFPAGLYAEEMLDSAKVVDKESKIEFLRLLIAAIEAATSSVCNAKPQKIVAGGEPENTNQMLQLLASCAALPSDKKAAAVAKAKGVAAVSSPEKKEKKPKEEKPKEEKPKEEKPKEEKPREEKKPKEEKPREEKPKEEKPKEKKEETEEERHRRHEEERRKRHEEKKREKGGEEERRRTQEERRPSDDQQRGSGQFSSSGAKEPATAGKAPPRRKPTHEVLAVESGLSAAPAAGVIVEAKRSDKSKKDGDEAAEEEEDWMKVAERYEQKPNAPTAGVAGDVEVKGKLGQQALKAKREQEEAALQAAAAAAASASSGGGIVISKGKSGVRGAHGASGSVMSDAELHKLREQLQLLTKASNPLGKFLEATHDDIDSMTRELETWRSEARNQAMAAAEARRQTQESLQEIQAQLQSMEDAISDQMLKTNNLRQTILANDDAINGMLGMIVGPDAAAAR